jgi:diguanylate cyclase (GGDEF)-like protein/PAS domain S-box-containing protein
MLRRLQFRKPYHRLQARLAVVMMLAGLALVAADLVGLRSARDEALRDAWIDSANIAASLADQTHGVLQTVTSAVSPLRDQMELDGVTSLSLARLNHMAATAHQVLPMLDGVGILDTSGRRLAGAGDLGDAQAAFPASLFFIHHRQDKARTPFIGWPARGADGIWALTVSLRADRADGGFAGVIFARVRLDVFNAMVGSVDVGQHGMVAMLRADGVLIARQPAVADTVGQVVVSPPPAAAVTRAERYSQLDGTLRLISDVWVKDAPLLVRAGRGKADVLASWSVMAAFHSIGICLILAGLSTLGWRLANSIGEREQSHIALRRTHAQLAELEAQTARANRFLEMAEQVAKVGHWRLNLSNGYAVTWSDEVYRLHGTSKDSFTPTAEHVINAFHPDDREQVRDAVRRTITTGQPFELVARVVWQDGTIRHLRTRGFFQPESAGTPPSVFGVIMDVTEQVRAEAALLAANAKAEAANAALESANHALQALVLQDALTGLSNRRHFDRALSQEFRRALRSGTSIGLVLIDVDQFKQYNDLYGHQAGDTCLRVIADVIPPLLGRPGDMAARYGGEEIVLLLPGTSQPGARAIAERVGAAVRALNIRHAGGVAGIVTISAGVEAFVPVRDLDTEAELLEHADLALYAAKHAGRDRVCCYGDLPQASALGVFHPVMGGAESTT